MKCRPEGFLVQYQVVLLPVSRKIFFCVINHMVVPHCTHQFQLAGVVHPGHFEPVLFCQLYPEGPHSAPGTVDQYFLTGLHVARIIQPLHGQRGSLGNGSGFGPAHCGGFFDQGLLRRTDVFGKTTPAIAQIPVHFIPRFIKRGSSSATSSTHRGTTDSQVLFSASQVYLSIGSCTADSGYALSLSYFFTETLLYPLGCFRAQATQFGVVTPKETVDLHAVTVEVQKG